MRGEDGQSVRHRRSETASSNGTRACVRQMRRPAEGHLHETALLFCHHLVGAIKVLHWDVRLADQSKLGNSGVLGGG